MRFFAIFFAVLTIVCGYFWATDAPGSGMAYPTIGFAVLGGGVLLYNKLRNGGFLNDRANCLTLGLLIWLPCWQWVLLALLVVALAVAIAYGLYYALRKLYSAWPG
jgi:hypothetical protein